jgi:hypothetical protein
MQIDKKYYNPDQHDVFKALTVKQPWADLLTRVVFRDESGEYHAEKTIEVRTRNINYRGDLLICSSAKPVDPWGRHPAGVTCGFVELYDTKPVEDFTPEDWAATCIPEDQRPKKGWGWLMRNPRRVVEMPIKGQLGLYNLIVPKGDITEYPRNVVFGADGWKLIQKRIKK